MSVIQDRTRLKIRQSIGRNLADMKLGVLTSTVDTTSVVDNKNFLGADDEFIGRTVYVYDSVASAIVNGEWATVTDSTGSTGDLTTSPAFTASPAATDKVELWKVFHPDDIHDVLDQAVSEATPYCMQPLVTTDNNTQPNQYEYDWLTGFASGNDFKAVSKVEYLYSTDESVSLDSCSTVWSELVDPDVTASVDSTTFAANSLKLVVAAGCGAGDILATTAITSRDLSQKDTITLWIYSTVALAAGDLQLLLDDTASCASPVESINIPAIAANTRTKVDLTMANPYSDTAIISVGIKMVVDKGAFTLYVRTIDAVVASSRIWKPVPLDQWEVVKGSTSYLKFSPSGISLVGTPTQIRITGYQIPNLMTADTDESEVDPQWVIAFATGTLLISHAKSSRLDIDDRRGLSAYWLAKATARLKEVQTTFNGALRYT